MAQTLITRLPYEVKYDATEIAKMAQKVDSHGLIFISIPIHVEHPTNGMRLICDLEDKGLTPVCCVAWERDRHIVTIRSKRLTNAWEPIVVFSRHKNYHINREAATKIKKGFDTKDGAFDEEEFQTCVGDHWSVRNDRRDRRFLPAGVVLNCGQLADLQAKDKVFDPYGNPSIKETCRLMGWEYVDGGAESAVRNISLKGISPEETA